jgi:hypothetical protein
VRPAFEVRTSARQVPLPHGTLPSTHPISSETKVTELGSNPAGTDACAGSGVGDGDALGDGEGSALGAVVTIADGDGLGLRDGVPAADEHAASSRTLPALPARRRVIRPVRVINARNAPLDWAVTTTDGVARNRSRSRHRPRTMPGSTPVAAENERWIYRSVARRAGDGRKWGR